MRDLKFQRANISRLDLAIRAKRRSTLRLILIPQFKPTKSSVHSDI
jgi:hypothetical protein